MWWLAGVLCQESSLWASLRDHPWSSTGQPLTCADCGPGAGHARLPLGAWVLSSSPCELFHREALDLQLAIIFLSFEGLRKHG